MQVALNTKLGVYKVAILTDPGGSVLSWLSAGDAWGVRPPATHQVYRAMVHPLGSLELRFLSRRRR